MGWDGMAHPTQNGFSFRHLNIKLNRVFWTGASAIETPLGNLNVNDNLRTRLLATGKFSIMEKQVDEEEHSGEMQYPFIQKIVKDAHRTDTVSVLPIMVGSINSMKEAQFGELLQPFLAQPGVFTVVSSDFCHWGSRFRFTPTGDNPSMPIHEFIQQLDRRGMDLIEMKEPGAFAQYLKETSNTICGRHPIGVWLNAMKNVDVKISFVEYAQSSAAKSKRDSSVSYASAVAQTA